MITPKRPNVLNVDLENNLVVTSYMDHKAQNKRGGFEIRRVGVFAELKEKDKDGKFIMPIDPQSYTTDKYDKQEYYQAKMGKCSHFAETLNSSLDNFLGLYFSDRDPAAFGDRYASLQKLDFMNARSLMSEVLKSDKKFMQVEEINSPEKLKHFTRTFYDFIMDRNKYTHGLLYLAYPSYAPVIQYENEQKKVEYAEIDDEIIGDYFSSYDYLSVVLNKIYELEVAEKHNKNNSAS
jgi:hypothetical protein